MPFVTSSELKWECVCACMSVFRWKDVMLLVFFASVCLSFYIFDMYVRRLYAHFRDSSSHFDSSSASLTPPKERGRGGGKEKKTDPGLSPFMCASVCLFVALDRFHCTSLTLPLA